MINFKKKVLDNGLTIIAHRDTSTPMAVVSVMYDAGSRDDNPEKTGGAHLLEHLMFGGSVSVPSYDREVQRTGGENNAFTSNDITNYYISLPAANLETGLWLESDRMMGLELSQKGLDIQKSVVTEEYRQRYINQPYGDLWMILRPLAYKTHPYRWPVIGSDISHIARISLDDMSRFYKHHYCPANAILAVAGGMDEEHSIDLAEKWFGHLKGGEPVTRSLPAEQPRKEMRQETVYRDVPSGQITVAYHMCGRNDPDYYATDLISDLLAGGRSSRFYRRLVMEKKIFSNVNAYITGDRDPGLFIVHGMVAEDIEAEQAYNEMTAEVNRIITEPPVKKELDKVMNKLEATRHYTHTGILNKAIDLAYYELIGDAAYLNDEIALYKKVKPHDIVQQASILFRPENSSVLFYLPRDRSKT
ncbi:MAG: insulinase family protein [Marinilabiliales bacterium]|nr:MAG: insulinase family protein [Marinilabiliales bacterium]